MTKKRKLTADQCLASWKYNIEKNNPTSRFLKKERAEMLEELVTLLYEQGIDYDEASWLKKEIRKFLVTRKGSKDSGKYRGWGDNVEKEYIGCLTNFYKEDTKVRNSSKVEISKTTEHYDSARYMPRLDVIVAWTKHIYQNQWTEAKCLEAHKIGGALNLLFQKEVLDSEWAKHLKLGENKEKPRWYSNKFLKK